MTYDRQPPSRYSRRAFITRTVVAGSVYAAASELGLPFGVQQAAAAQLQSVTLPPGKDPADFLIHSSLTFETKRQAFGTSVVVPTALLYVRNNVAPPSAPLPRDPDEWQLRIEGVSRPGMMTVGALRRLGVETVAAVLQCSGNGRKFSQHAPSGSPWEVGAAGCVIWSGVPVRLVAEALGGALPGARYATATGAEEIPDGLDPMAVVVERSVPLEKAMEDALLAWELNGEPVPLAHGGPLRLVVPGYFGINQIKYVKQLAFTSEESTADIMRTGYRVRPIGEGGDPTQPTMWEMSVKSWINHPIAGGIIPAGPTVIDGVAFGGMRGIRRVEVSLDGGRSWRDAPLVGPNLGRYAWRQFALPTTLGRGQHTITSRATDDAGNIQPESRTENERGYGNTSWRDHAVNITAA